MDALGQTAEYRLKLPATDEQRSEVLTCMHAWLEVATAEVLREITLEEFAPYFFVVDVIEDTGEEVHIGRFYEPGKKVLMTPEIEKIIRAMAAYKPELTEGDFFFVCRFCDVWPRSYDLGDDPEKFEHKPDCPVELARAWVNQHPST